MLVRADPQRRRHIVRKVGDHWIPQLYMLPAKLVLNPAIGFFRRLLGIDKRFPGEFIRIYKALFRHTFHMNANNVESENYWLPYFYVSSSSPSNVSLLRTWLHLYGFSRNTSAAAYLASSFIAVWIYLNPTSHDQAARTELAILLVIACVLGIRYWLLFSTYYTKNIIRALLFTPQLRQFLG